MLCRHAYSTNSESEGSGGVYVEAGLDIDSRGFPLAREAFGNEPDAVRFSLLVCVDRWVR